MRNKRAFGIAVVVVVLGALPSACSTSQSAVAAGGACLVATDCEPGLVCIQQGSAGDRVCSSDLSSIQKTETTDSGKAADGAATDGQAAQPEGAAPPTDAGTNPVDTFQPPVDSGSPTDSGAGG